MFSNPTVKIDCMANVQLVVSGAGNVDVVHGHAKRAAVINGIEGMSFDSVATLPRSGHSTRRRWSKTMSEPAGRQASRMAGGGGFEPPLTGPEPVVLPLDDPPAEQSHYIVSKRRTPAGSRPVVSQFKPTQASERAANRTRSGPSYDAGHRHVVTIPGSRVPRQPLLSEPRTLGNRVNSVEF